MNPGMLMSKMPVGFSLFDATHAFMPHWWRTLLLVQWSMCS
jgi:hypothetical protein